VGILGFGVGLAVGASGLVGAIYWYLASRTSRPNRIAAVWTGVASILAIVGSFISFLTGQTPNTGLNAVHMTIQGGAGINAGTMNIYPPAPTAAGPTPRTYQGGPGIPFEDEEVHGVLKPANEPTPPNGCDGAPISADALKDLIGDNATTREGTGLVVPIGIRDCVPLSMERRPDGIFVNASLYDRENGAVVTIRDNRISALNGTNYTARQSRDESRLTVRNAKGTELFYVRFLNPTTIQFRGFLGCSANETILVKENQPIPGTFMKRNCFGNAGRAIQIGLETKKSP
jgi:hypothetical protein